MTSVPPVGQVSKDTSAQVASATSVDYNTFLKLLVAQLKNQDPTQPMDSKEFLSQLASFSQVEQSVTINSKLDSLLTSSALSLADSVIGKSITSSDGTISGTVASVKITSDGPVATLADGQTLSLGSGVTITGS